ncbi:hypothetical protein E4U25_002471 [Claviceps purpurea]|nr:hypothetical protein E4U25_002471 [Claviceps purpurea]
MALLDSKTSRDNSKLPAILELMALPVTNYDGVPAYGFPDPNPQDPMPVDPRTILAALVHLDHKAIPFGPYGCGFNGPFGPYGYSGNTLPPMALNRNITTPTNLTTLKHVKAVPTLTTKTEGSNGAKKRSSKHTRKTINTQASQMNSSCPR